MDRFEDIPEDAPEDQIFFLDGGVPVRTGMLVGDDPLIDGLMGFADAIGVLNKDAIAKILNDPNRKAGRSRWEAVVWVKNQGRRGSCFPAGTLIRMADGSQKQIEEVRLLDEVLTAEGNIGRVMRTMVRSHTGTICKLKAWGHRHLLATAEHPILTKTGYKKIADLTKSDWVAIPKYVPSKTESIVPYNYTNQRTIRDFYKMNRVHSQKLCIPGKTAVDIKTSPLPELIVLDKQFGRLVGLFLAEGSIDSRKIRFHFHSNEEHTLAAEVVETFRELFGVDAHVRVGRGEKQVCDVTIYGRLWTELFYELTCTGSRDKELHRDLCNGPRDFLEAVLSGWQDGDGLGCDGIGGGVSISHRLAMCMFDIGNALGKRPTVETHMPSINPKHGIKTRQLRYIVTWPAERKACVSEKSEETDSHVYRKVCDVEQVPFSGFVYNLEVEGDHSYVAESIGVHNCNAYACASVLEKSRVIRGQTPVKLGPEWLYAQINGGRDRGSLLKDGILAMETKGVPRSELVPYESYLKSQQKPEATEDAQRFRILRGEYFGISSEEEMATALAMNFMCLVACQANNSWMKLDPSGVVHPTDGMGNHAIHLDDVRIANDGEYQFDHQGSWGTRYGQNGRGWTTWKRHYKTTVRYHQFVAVRSTIDDPLGLKLPNRGNV